MSSPAPLDKIPTFDNLACKFEDRLICQDRGKYALSKFTS